MSDSLSSEIFSRFIKEIDPQQNILLASDYVQLNAYRYKLDDELNGAHWEFYNIFSGLYKKALQRVDTILNTVLQKPIDIDANEEIVFSNKNDFNFSATTADLRTRYAKWFKFLFLNTLYDVASSDSSHPALKTLLPKYEAAIRQKIKKSESEKIGGLLDPANFDSNLKETFFNAIATSFDPHTMYFSPKKKEDFQSQLSTEEFSFGFYIAETAEGKITITQLVPGGPAWKSGELNKNDELLQVQWEGKDPVDVTVLPADEVQNIFGQYNHGSVTLKVKKANSIIRTVVLKKEKIESEEDVVKGYVLKADKKAGYISLPDFYTSWEDGEGSGCANDVAKEIMNLKKENIDGLILDLRYNGGGSLAEALQMIGIFVDEGPLTAIREKNGKLSFLKDPNRGTIYDGPMVLLVNEESASASEMLAGTLQDYNRAVIVGSNTYGKATMQEIFPMDTVYPKSTNSPYGFVKITTGKLYRVSGETAQRKGVVPDVVLPDVFDGLKYGEKFETTALPADTARRNPYYKPLTALPVSQLAAASLPRIMANENFTDIKNIIARRSKFANSERQAIPLKAELFVKWMKENEGGLLEEERVTGDSKFFTADNHQAEKQRLALNLASKDMNDYAIRNIQKDIYIEEAFRVLTDLINLQKTNH